MSSDLFLLDGSCFINSSSEIISSDVDLQFLSDSFFPFSDLPSDIFQSFSDDPVVQFPADPSPSGQFPADPSPSVNQSAVNLFSGSPPCQRMNNLSLGSTTQLQVQPTGSNSAVGLASLSVLDTIGVKSEDCFIKFDFSPTPSLLPNSYDSGRAEKAALMMQRSFSSQALDRKPGFLFQPHFNPLIESPDFQIQVMGSPENNNCTVPMRRVCSTGDIQRIKSTLSSNGFSSSPLAAANSFTEEAIFKVRRYTAEERKERIQKYRSKRTHRNFTKTIKYACRKTLADGRPRVRGRFARNDETGEIPKVRGLNKEEEDEDEPWVDGFHEEGEEALIRRGGGVGGAGFINSLSQTQFQYYGF